MAIYRQVHITFWQDPFILELTAEEKYFYIYLLTNSKTTQCGIYEISELVIMLETGLSKEKVGELLDKFIGYKKIKYDRNTKEIFILNWLKFNSIEGINTEKCVLKELKTVKQTDFIKTFLGKCVELKFKIPNLKEAYKGFIRGLIDNNKTETPPCKKQEQEQEQEEEEEQKEQEQTDVVVPVEKNIYKVYEGCGYGTISSYIKESLDSMVNDFTFEWTKEALEIGTTSGSRNLKYVQGILNNWRSKGKVNKNGGNKQSNDGQPEHTEGIGISIG